MLMIKVDHETPIAAEISRDWVQELGVVDGAAIAAQVIDELGSAETPEQIDAVSQDTVATVRALADTYRERGVSDPLVQAWRTACQREMARIFRDLRQTKELQEPETTAPSLADTAGDEGEKPLVLAAPAMLPKAVFADVI